MNNYEATIKALITSFNENKPSKLEPKIYATLNFKARSMETAKKKAKREAAHLRNISGYSGLWVDSVVEIE